MVKKIISYILIFAIVISLCAVFAYATVVGDLIMDSTSVDGWSAYFDNNYILGSYEGLGLNAKSFYWKKFDKAFASLGLGSVSSYDELFDIATDFKTAMQRSDGSFTYFDFNVSLGRPTPTAVVAYDSSIGVYRLRDDYSGLWLVNSAGHFPYFRPEDTGEDPDQEPYRPGQWRNVQDIDYETALWNICSSYELNTYRDYWIDLYPDARILEQDSFYSLVRTDRYTAYVLCDEYGNPYYIPKPGKTAVATPNEYYTNITNNYVDDNDTTVNVVMDGNTLVGHIIDVDNGIINVGGEVYYIDELIYNPETNTYYVDAHTEYTYNSETNNYETNYAIYQTEYNIYYTSVTYIGQTEEYQERYEYYYQLPDGRSSADLTAEDLEQLSIVFADLVPYTRTADDTDLRALYHFDGSTEDSSYWSYITEFTWNSGASLTYLDEGTFNGSLYLDELEHDFTIKLPNLSDCAGDFTLQFRYYQSHTEVPVLDSWISFGSSVQWKSDGAVMYDGSGNVICAVPVGSWNEICFLRSGGTLYYYLNGLCVGSAANSPNFDGTIIFHFGADQKTYKKLDELRFTKRAVYTAGESYSPTSVPHDTNLALILPDGEYAIADEIMELTPSSGNLLNASGLSDWTQGVPGNLVAVDKTHFQPNAISSVFANGPMLVYNKSFSKFAVGEGATSFHTTVGYYSTTFDWNEDVEDCTYSVLRGGLFLPLAGCSQTGSLLTNLGNPTNVWYSGVTNRNYTLTVVLSDGRYSTITARVTNTGSLNLVSNNDCSAIDIEVAEFSSTTRMLDVSTQSYTGYAVQYVRGFVIIPTVTGEPVDIVHIELVTGTAPKLSVEWDQAVFTSSELENSPVLAVRTNREITGYQIGGVRPSYPSEGLVYAMVENSRIVSLQQYTGTAWEAVDGRIWTGERWIPYSSFDVFTLQDFFDMTGTSEDYEYIYSESGFWSWFQKQWKNLIDLLNKILEAIQDLSGGAKTEDEKELDDSKDTVITVFLNKIFRVEVDDGSHANRITEDDLNDIGSVLDNSRDLFDTGFSIGSMFD